ncbi:MAG: OmpA family protein [Bacteroidetes bacterium]|nr:OmpA family protein [Bacteroidota bacterium]
MKTLTTIFLFFLSIVCNAQQASRTLHFDSGKSDIAAKDKQWLDSIADVLKNAVSYTIDVKAYCDADGSEDANNSLAKARAGAVKAAFVAAHLNESKISMHPFGESDPVADNATDKGKSENRRALVTIMFEQKKIEPVKTESNELVASNLEVGKKLILKNLNFVGGSDELLPESAPVLKDLLKLMNDNPGLEVEIGGHVCCGPAMELSVQRAKRVYDYLVENGVAKKRLTYKGYSFDKPIASDNTEDGKTRNRRVEITVLKL